jgi:hypothetical protein
VISIDNFDHLQVSFHMLDHLRSKDVLNRAEIFTECVHLLCFLVIRDDLTSYVPISIECNNFDFLVEIFKL